LKKKYKINVFVLFVNFQIELENLNSATDVINKLEIELEVSKLAITPKNNF